MKQFLDLPSMDEIAEINKKFGGVLMNRSQLEFLAMKLKSLRPSKNMKRSTAKVAANLFYYLISGHVFSDGNKRTATEAIRLLLRLNGFALNMHPNGFVYLSLRVSNNDMSLNGLMQKLYERLEVRK